MFPDAPKFAVLIALAAVLSGCSTTGMFHQPGEAYISEVTVSAAPFAPPGFDERVRASIVADAQRFPQTGAAKRVSIMVTSYHIKDPGLSLLVGDDNRVTGTLTVLDAATGAPSSPAFFTVTNGNFPQGVAGLVLAAAQDAGLQENELAVQTGHAALEQFYGSKLLRTYVNGRQVAAPPSAAAPAPAPAPAIGYVPSLPAPHKQLPGTS
jgi:hypothetical protein